MTDQDITLGEISRSVDRIETGLANLSTQVQAAMTLGAGHTILIATNAAEAKELKEKLDNLVTRSAYISGGIAALVSAANFFLGRHT